MSNKYTAWAYDAYGHPLRSYSAETAHEALELAHRHESTHLRVWRAIKEEVREYNTQSRGLPMVIRIDELDQLRINVNVLSELIGRVRGMPGELPIRSRLELALKELVDIEARYIRWLEIGGF